MGFLCAITSERFALPFGRPGRKRFPEHLDINLCTFLRGLHPAISRVSCHCSWFAAEYSDGCLCRRRKRHMAEYFAESEAVEGMIFQRAREVAEQHNVQFLELRNFRNPLSADSLLRKDLYVTFRTAAA